MVKAKQHHQGDFAASSSTSPSPSVTPECDDFIQYAQRINENGYRLPDPLPFGTILTDSTKRQWQLGESIGCGGFGEIYCARELPDITSDKDDREASSSSSSTGGKLTNAGHPKRSCTLLKTEPPASSTKSSSNCSPAHYPFVVKVDHMNGPLYAEMHFYHRAAKPKQIDSWMLTERLAFLGMPRYVASGIHDQPITRQKRVLAGVDKKTKTKKMKIIKQNLVAKYRFLVLDRLGIDLQKILAKQNNRLDVKSAYTIAMMVIDTLAYIHSHGYIHADIKASNLLLGRHESTPPARELYLVDYGLVERYMTRDGEHKEQEEDQRRANNGTIEFTSRDGHLGELSRRSDLEILVYNVISWLSGGRLPWMECKDHEIVRKKKCHFMKNIDLLLKHAFIDKSKVPKGLEEFVRSIGRLGFKEEPDYEQLKLVLTRAIVSSGFSNDGLIQWGKMSGKKGKANGVGKKAGVNGKKRLASTNGNLNGNPAAPAHKLRKLDVGSAAAASTGASPALIQPSLPELFEKIDGCKTGARKTGRIIRAVRTQNSPNTSIAAANHHLHNTHGIAFGFTNGIHHSDNHAMMSNNSLNHHIRSNHFSIFECLKTAMSSNGLGQFHHNSHAHAHHSHSLAKNNNNNNQHYQDQVMSHLISLLNPTPQMLDVIEMLRQRETRRLNLYSPDKNGAFDLNGNYSYHAKSKNGKRRASNASSRANSYLLSNHNAVINGNNNGSCPATPGGVYSDGDGESSTQSHRTQTPLKRKIPNHKRIAASLRKELRKLKECKDIRKKEKNRMRTERGKERVKDKDYYSIKENRISSLSSTPINSRKNKKKNKNKKKQKKQKKIYL